MKIFKFKLLLLLIQIQLAHCFTDDIEGMFKGDPAKDNREELYEVGEKRSKADKQRCLEKNEEEKVRHLKNGTDKLRNYNCPMPLKFNDDGTCR